MKKGQIREGIVMDVKFPNKGNVKLMPASADAEAKSNMKENGTEERSCIQAEEKEEFCTVKNVLPGQHLSLMITKVRKGKGEGRVLQFLRLHPMRFRLPAPISETAAAVHTWPCLMKNSSA